MVTTEQPLVMAGAAFLSGQRMFQSTDPSHDALICGGNMTLEVFLKKHDIDERNPTRRSVQAIAAASKSVKCYSNARAATTTMMMMMKSPAYRPG
jgi:hypothetical protein